MYEFGPGGGASEAYVLVTAAYNEECVIRGTIESVIAQTVLPAAWIIISDGSTDGTDDIVRRYAHKFSFIQLLRLERGPGRDFASKVNAVESGIRRLQAADYEFIGNLDSDVTFAASYFAELIAKFRPNRALGIAGGWIQEDYGSGFENRKCNSPDSVPHAVHFLRRRCYESIGGYVALPHGGEDTCAVFQARMLGWEARAFDDLPVQHHRRTASAGGHLRNRIRQGRADYSLGYHPAFEILKCVRRLRDYPYLIGACLWMVGFMYDTLRRTPRPVSTEFVRYLRAYQKQRMRVSAVLGRAGERTT